MKTLQQDSTPSTASQADGMAQAAALRNPTYPGFEAVRDLYDAYLKLARHYDDLALQVETLKHELAALRRGEVSNG